MNLNGGLLEGRTGKARNRLLGEGYASLRKSGEKKGRGDLGIYAKPSTPFREKEAQHKTLGKIMRGRQMGNLEDLSKSLRQKGGGHEEKRI